MPETNDLPQSPPRRRQQLADELERHYRERAWGRVTIPTELATAIVAALRAADAAPVDLGAAPALRPSIYIASKTRHAPKWLALREGGHRIVSTWIDEAGPGESVDLGDLAERCIEESKAADLFIIYSEPGDVLKGAWAEAGARLATGKVVLAVGPFDPSAFTHHVNWRSRATVGDALACAAGGGGGRGEGRC